MKKIRKLTLLVISLTQLPIETNWINRKIQKSERIDVIKAYKSITFHSMLLPILTCYISKMVYEPITDTYDYYLLLTDNDTTSQFMDLKSKENTCHGWNTTLLNENSEKLQTRISPVDQDDPKLRNIFEYKHIRYCHRYKIIIPKDILENNQLKLQLTKKHHRCLIPLN